MHRYLLLLLLLVALPAPARAATFLEGAQGNLTCTTMATPAEKAALGTTWLPGTHEAQRRYFSAARSGTRDYHFRYLTLLQAVADLSDEVDDQVVRRDVLARIIHYTGQPALNARGDLLFRQIQRCAWVQAMESSLGSGDAASLGKVLVRLQAAYSSLPVQQSVEDWPLIQALRDLRGVAGSASGLTGLVAVAVNRGTAYRNAGDTDLAQRIWVAAGRGLLELGQPDRAYQVVMAATQGGQPAARAHQQRWRAYPVLFDYFHAKGQPDEAARLETLFAGRVEAPDAADAVGNFEVFHRLSWGANSRVDRFIRDARFRSTISGAELDRLIDAGTRFGIDADRAMKDYRISLTALRRAQRDVMAHAYEDGFLPELTRNDPGHAPRQARTYLDMAQQQITKHVLSNVLVNKRARLIYRREYAERIGTLSELLPYVRQERDEIVDTTFRLAQLASHNGAAAVGTSGLMGLNRDGPTSDSLTWNLRFIENPAAMLEMLQRSLDGGNAFLASRGSGFSLDDPFMTISLLRSDVFENREQFAAILARRAPQLAPFVLGAPFSIASFQKLLGRSDAIVATHLAHDALHVWVVTARGAKLASRRIPATEVDRLVERLRGSVEQAVRNPLRDSIPYDAEAAWKLFELTFGQVMADLAGSTRVYWYGDKSLAAVPPAIFLTRAPARAQLATLAELKSAAFLAREFPLVTMPELSVYPLALLPARGGDSTGTTARRDFLGIGGTQLTAAELSTDTSLARSLDLAGGDETTALQDLPRLPETVGTLRAIETSMGAQRSTLWLGPDATKQKLLDTDLRAYRVLVLATHGFLAGEMADCRIGPYPSLLLTQPAGTTSCREALLTTPEISQLQLDADLVVLSACNTARSGSRGGAEDEPFLGLAAAFGAAGARNLAVSHWPVLVGAASDLTAGLVQRARNEGLAVDLSLQRSIEQLRANARTALEAHPAYWGPFVLVGSGRTTFAGQ